MKRHGTDPGVSSSSLTQVQVIARAQFQDTCCCIGPRTYFHVLENSIEGNFPCYFGICFPNPFCLDFDIVCKTFYDRGPWENRSCLYALGFIQGTPTFYSHNPKQVCLCVDCPELYNDLAACYCPCCCGDRVIHTPFDSCCFGLCSSRASACTNLCGLCGAKTGEPQLYRTLLCCLLRGSGEHLSTSINNARVSWSVRTNKA